MRLSWCRERAISPYRPQWTEQALRQTWRGRRQSSHWLHRFKRQSRWNERCQDSSAKLDQSVEFWTVCESIVWLFVGVILLWESSREIMLFVFPKTLGKFFTYLSLIDQAQCVVATFHWCFHLVEWITAGCIWDYYYYYMLCKKTNQLLKTAYLFRSHTKCLVLSW